MCRSVLALLAGALLTSRLPWLPPADWCWVAAPFAAALACHGQSRVVAAGIAGSVLFWASAAAALADRLPADQSGNDFRFIAEIVDFTRWKGDRATLLVAPADPALPAHVRLGWYGAGRDPGLGERWRFDARLKRPRGSRNPGGFDYEGWLHRERIGASGYVLRAERVEGGAMGLAFLRRAAVERIEELLPAGDARAALLAIAVGARHRMTDAAWERYARTGTSHLMAISGLHVGLAATGAGLVGWLLAGLVRPRGNLRDAATAVAVPAAAAYAAIAGFAVPAQRAFLMAAAAAWTLCLRRPPDGFAVLAAVAAVVFAADPLAVLAPGFLLSFGAVAVLLGAARRAGTARRAGFRQLGPLQLALLLGLFPLTAALFGRAAWLAPLANLCVLPVFSAVTVPAALGGLLLAGPLAAAGDALLQLAWWSLRAVLAVLDVLAGLPGADLELARPDGAARWLPMLPLAWVLLPAGFPGRGLAWLGFAAALAYRPAAPPPGCLDHVTLDVGQGLAVVIETARHSVVFDTGPAWRGGTSAERVLLPYLASRGIRRVDRLVVSHADQDHAGGVDALRAGLDVVTVMAGEELTAAPDAVRCRAGDRWSYDGVTFRVLHPVNGREEGNDASCVVEASAGPHRLLLTGDIEKRSERRLVAGGALRPAGLVHVPHHGSRTSSGPEFVAAAGALDAIVSAGHGNRWGFPKPDVAARWRQAGARVLETAKSGAIRHRLCRETGIELTGEYRRDARRYWHDVGD